MDAVTVHQPTRPAAEAEGRDDAVRRGFVLTGVTLAATVAGLAAGWRGAGVAEAAAYAVAFLAGGVPAAAVAWAELREERKLNVDLLMVLAALGAASVGEAGDGAILLFLFSLSNALQAWAFRRTESAIRSLMALSPEGATVVREDGTEEWVALESLAEGDVVLLRPGERVPADGALVSGYTTLDESAITGESIPVEKSVGGALFSGTLNGDGVVRMRVQRPASESTLARLIRLVEEAKAAKSPTEAFAERLEGPYTAAVLLSAPLIFALLYGLLGYDAGPAWYRAMTFLVVASPCAVVISTPAAVLSAMAAGARRGILFKSGAALEALARVRVVAFDKTGTLTEGRMRLERVAVLEGTEAEARALAAGLERHSEHPIARAVVAGHEGPLPAVAEVQAVRGRGIAGRLDGERVWAGTRRMARDAGTEVSAAVEGALEELESAGLTTVILGRERRVVALLGVADAARAEAGAAVRALHAAGLRTAMLTGDRGAVAGAIAARVGIDEVCAELLPEDKLRAVESLRVHGPVAMVGDGVNDAPALASADLGVAIGSGSDVSLESAEVVLMKSDLSRLAYAVELSRAAARTIRFNLLFALGIIVVVGALALVGVVPLPLGVVAHEGGTLLVVGNGLRLLTFAGSGARGAG